MNQIFELEVVTHQKLHGNRIPCCFEDVCEPTRIPIRVNKRVNRKTAAASRNKRGGGKTMTLKLIEVKDLPQAGKQLGTLVDLVMAVGKDEDGQDFKDLVLTGDLDATDKAGKKYRVEKRYNLLGRGLGIFRTDYHSWSGRKLKDKDLVEFDSDKLIKNQRATFDINLKKQGTEMVAVIDRLLPVAAAAQASGS
jgi:hypothetical protein